MSPLAMSYTLDLEPTYPTEEQAHEAYLLGGWDCLQPDEVTCELDPFL